MCGDSSSTFGELDVRLRRLATVLDDLGTSFGDRIAILAGNSDRYVELYCGVPASGRAIVPLNTRWAEPELAYALDDADVSVLFVDRDPGPLADHVGRVVLIPDEYEQLLSTARPGEFADVDESTLAGLFYTGGTTGASKGVMLTHRNLVANAFHSQICTPVRPDDSYLVVAPLFHAAGSNGVLQSIGQGTRQVILEGAFDPEATLDLIDAVEEAARDEVLVHSQRRGHADAAQEFTVRNIVRPPVKT